MKKVLVGLIFASVLIGASAQHREHHNHRPRSYNPDWIAPLVIGGVIGYAITQNNQQQQPPVIYTQPPTVVNTYEIVYIDGIAYKRSRMFINGQWQDVLVKY